MGHQQTNLCFLLNCPEKKFSKNFYIKVTKDYLLLCLFSDSFQTNDKETSVRSVHKKVGSSFENFKLTQKRPDIRMTLQRSPLNKKELYKFGRILNVKNFLRLLKKDNVVVYLWWRGKREKRRILRIMLIQPRRERRRVQSLNKAQKIESKKHGVRRTRGIWTLD